MTLRGFTRARLHRGVLAVGVALAFFVIPSITHADPVLTLIPSSFNAVEGENLAIDIVADDFTDLFAYQFDITYDPLVLQAMFAVDGEFLTSGGGVSLFGGLLTLSIDNTLGVITILNLLTGPAPPALGATGTGILARISFSAVGSGTSGVTLENTILENSVGVPIAAPVNGTSIAVAPRTATVPEPAPLALFGLGLALLLVSRRVVNRRVMLFATDEPSDL